MNKRIDLLNLGGFPFTQGTLEWMQDSHREAFKGIARLCGDKTILTGVVVSGSAVSAGWISYGGELMKFNACSLATDVVIAEVPTAGTFQDNSVHDIYFEKTAVCGASGTFPFADLVRLDSIKNVWLTGDVKEVDCDAAYITANFDGTGLGINERAGWAICNGDNGTKDRGGRVSVGYETVTVDPSNNVWDAIYNTIGATGGEKRHTLITSEMPAHTHSIQPAYVTGTSAPSNVRTDSTSGSVGQAVTGSTGGGGSHENRQPFIVTLFIQKL